MSKQLALPSEGAAAAAVGTGVDEEAGVVTGTAVGAAVAAGVGVGVTRPPVSCRPEGRVGAGVAAIVLTGDEGTVPVM